MPAAGHNPPPGFLRRLASMVYEALLLLGVLALVLALPHVLIGAFTHQLATPTTLQAHFFLVLLIYFLWFWCHGGQTLAMKTWRIRVVAKEGHGRLLPKAALLRFIYALLLVPTTIGILWAMVDRDRQFLHDRLAGTRLVLLSAAPPTTSSSSP